MGMSTHVVGFIPPDEGWKKMKAVWDTCALAGIDPPDEVSRFFQDMPPDDRGIEIERPELERLGAAREWSDDMCQGYEVDLSKLPPEVKFLRFFNSY